MKLVLAIVSTSDAPVVASAMSKAGYPATVTNSYGGFLSKENAVIFSGIDDAKVRAVVKIIGENTTERVEDVSTAAISGRFKLPSSIKIGGAVVFVLGVEQFFKL